MQQMIDVIGDLLVILLELETTDYMEKPNETE
jgi:hypothetical protein